MKIIHKLLAALAMAMIMGSLSPSFAGNRKSDSEQTREEREREEERRKAREERLKRQREFHNIGNAGKHNKESYENEKEKARKQALAAAALAAKVKTPKESVGPIPQVIGKKMTWTGTLSQESVNLDLADKDSKVKVVVLTTNSGQRVVFSPKSVAEYSLSGLDLRSLVGSEVTITAMATPRRVAEKPCQYVHTIKLMMQKKSAMFDDLE